MLLKKSTKPMLSPGSSFGGSPVKISSSSSSESIAYGSLFLLCFLIGAPPSTALGITFARGADVFIWLLSAGPELPACLDSNPLCELIDSLIDCDICELDLLAGEIAPRPVSVVRLFVVSIDRVLLTCAPGGPSFKKLIRSSLACRSGLNGPVFFFAASRLVFGTIDFTEGFW